MAKFERRRVTASLNSEGGAEQQHRKAVNINSIMAKYQRTGSIEHFNPAEPLYGDFSFVVPLHEAMQQVEVAEGAFMALPSEVRAAAENDPVLFLEMLDDQEGSLLLQRAGLPLGIEDLAEDDDPSSASDKSDSPPQKPDPADSPDGDPEA